MEIINRVPNRLDANSQKHNNVPIVAHRCGKTAIRLATLSVLLLVTSPLSLHWEAAQRMTQPDDTSNRAEDRDAISRTLQRFLDAWNTHDAHAFAATFTEDCDFTNVVGMHEHGRANVESFHAPLFRSVFKDSHQTAQVRSVRFLGPRLAQVDVDWQMTGAGPRNGDPRPNRKGLLDWLVSRQPDGAWLIEIMHNTDLTNLPQKPKSSEASK
ncbi:MAG TPA: SgcJ/EcaC family oxidoreductase [Candidatus Limnocylindrales bacterium]|nr:SgcJ/EcaC family oxidoreductase [Candidatus Limnocylindrales bacterium]